MGEGEPVVELRDVVVDYRPACRRDRELPAVDGVSLAVRPGQVLGMVSKSGSGKSSLARAMVGLLGVGGGEALVDRHEWGRATREQRSALHVSVQAQVINVLSDLRDEFGLGLVFVAHDLAVAHHISDEVAVMYRGRVVERGPADGVLRRPRHPYTARLVASVPGRRAGRPPGPPPTSAPSDPAVGCRFRDRCPIGPLVHPERTVCAEVDPALQVVDGGPAVACDFAARGRHPPAFRCPSPITPDRSRRVDDLPRSAPRPGDGVDDTVDGAGPRRSADPARAFGHAHLARRALGVRFRHR